jgi:hypothetical protein
MIMPFGHDPAQIQLAKAVSELESCNREIGRHGLSLSTEDIQALVAGRLESLEVSERVEFGGGVAKDLVLAFASSSYVSQATFVQQVLELQDLFYEFKNESLEQIPDDELIAKMRSLFDDVANGDMVYLAEGLFDGLGRHVRDGVVTAAEKPTIDQLTLADRIDAGTGFDDAVSPGEDDATMNMHTLAARRYDVSKWVDETYAPPWEGSSWLDE